MTDYPIIEIVDNKDEKTKEKINDIVKSYERVCIKKTYPYGGDYRMCWTYYVKGEIHKDDGPATIHHFDCTETEYWMRHNTLHREDGPAVVSHHRNNIVNCIEVNGKLKISPDYNKKYLSYEKWYIYGKLHRGDGPAEIHYYTNKKREKEIYYINNVKQLEKIYDKNGNIINKKN